MGNQTDQYLLATSIMANQFLSTTSLLVDDQ